MANVPLTTPWSPNKQHSDRERWVCIYPAYLNSKKTRQEGRKLPKPSCVENPSYQEIKDVLQANNFPVIVENKLYPREKSKELQFRGRIRVQLRNDVGTPLNPEFPSRDSLLIYCGKMIPQLKTRQGKPNDPAAAPTASTSASHSQKKGKGKRR